MAVVLWLSYALTAGAARADVGVVIYESKGVDARRTNTGHISLIATKLCAEGIDKVRSCRPGEEPGVIVTRYANLAYGYDTTLFVVPIRDHLTATREASQFPALSSGGTLDAMQIDYWRSHLRPYLPPLTPARYQELKTNLERFDMGRALRKTISMELLIGLLAPHRKKYPTEPIALIDPLTNEMIPNGRWREVVGVTHMRGALSITSPVSAEQEAELIGFIQTEIKEPFQALDNNCSDFVARGLLRVFAASGLHFRRRTFMVADAWITTPLEVATGFLNYAKKEKVYIDVEFLPMMAGTRRPTGSITSISRGALVPSPAQGKMAFSMKIYFNTLNPLLALTSYSVDKLSFFANLPRLIHERGGGELSRLAYEIGQKAEASKEDRMAWRREQMRVFGTRSCWQQKREVFSQVAAQAQERGLLTVQERGLLLRTGRPFLLPRLYEQAAAAQKQEGMLTVGMHTRALLPPGLVSSFFPPGLIESSTNTPAPTAAVPGRPEIKLMAASNNPEERLLALRLMVSVVNFDLSSEPLHRRLTDSFEQDWTLLLDVARKNGLRLADSAPISESLANCSCREFDERKTNNDAYGEAQGYWRWLATQGRDLAFGANR